MIIRTLLFFMACGLAPAVERPAEWAKPVVVPGVGNFHKITDRLYRGAQPTAEGFRELEKRGIKTVLNLRDNHDDRDEAKGTGIRLLRVEMEAWDIEDDEVAEALALLRKRKNAPFLVHCQHGSDRTGVVCAMFRMVEQGWSRADAIRELRDGGYGFHRVWKNISRYLEKVDVEKMRRKVGKLSAGLRGGKAGIRSAEYGWRAGAGRDSPGFSPPTLRARYEFPKVSCKEIESLNVYHLQVSNHTDV